MSILWGKNLENCVSKIMLSKNRGIFRNYGNFLNNKYNRCNIIYGQKYFLNGVLSCNELYPVARDCK